MTKSRSLSVCACFAVALAATAAVSCADTVYFNNGDILTCKITAIGDGKLAVTSPAEGDLKIDLKNVKTLATESPIDVRLSDGTIVHGTLTTSGTGEVVSRGGIYGDQPVQISNIKSFPAVLAPVWTGNIKFGGLLIRGNTSSETVSLGVAVDRKTEQDELSYTGDYLYGRTKDRQTGVTTTTEENWQMEAKYAYNFTKKLYGYADVQLQKDRLAFLDLRVSPTVGLGYKWVDKPDLSFATEGGIGWVYENYTNNTPTREDVSVQLAYHLVKKFNDKVSLVHNTTYEPSIEHGSKYLVETDVELKSMIDKHWFTDFKFELDFDSKPANGALKTNTRYELDLGYSL